MVRICTFLISLLILNCSYSTELRFTKFDVDDGLSHEVIRGIVQDSSGFIWVATEAGLNRFDGFVFEEFQYRGATSESENVLSDIAMDGEGNIWLGTFGSGVLRFNTTTYSFSRFSNDQLTSNNISKVFVDSMNNIWVGTIENGLNLIEKTENDEFNFLKFDEQRGGPSHSSITAISEDNLGRIWIGTDGGGVDIFQQATNSWIQITNDKNDNNSLSSNRVTSLLKDHNGNMWIGTANNGLNKYNLSDKSMSRFTHDPSDPRSINHNRVLSIFEDNEHRIFVGSDKGLSILSNGIFENHVSDRTNPEGLSNNRIVSVFQDSSDMIWIGTYRGINKWNPATSLFNHTLPRINPDLDYSLALAFEENENGDILIGTYGGGIAIQKQDGTWDNITTKHGLNDNRIMSLHVDRENGLWVGTRGNGLLYKRPDEDSWKQFTHTPEDTASLPSNGITSILEDTKGNIWVATYAGGLSKKVTEGFINITKQGSQKNSLSSQNVFQVIEDQNGYIWLATDNGLNLVNPEDYSVTQYLASEGDAQSLASEISWNLFEDSKGNFWIATQGSGIQVWNYQDRIKRIAKFTSITKNDGLPSNTIYGFEEDANGNIWFSSARGIGKVNQSDFTVESFNKKHGLQGNDFHLGAVFKDSSGKIFFGGTNGFNQFMPEQISRKSPPPKVQLLGITSIDTRVAIPQKDELLEFDYNDYLIAFDYVALDFAAPEKNQYQYQLEPFDSDWLHVGNLRRATYTNLPAGNYTFKVRAANNDGVWSEAQINLPLKVHPAPWRTPVAYGFYVFVISLVIYMFLSHQMRKLAAEEKQRKLLERQVKERTEELAQQNKKLHKLNEDLEVAHRVDALTGVNNRHFLDTYLKEALPKLDAGQEKPFMLVLIIDLDNLKPINDANGHGAGDAVIHHLASLIDGLVPEGFHLIRWGGDEFMLVGTTDDKNTSPLLANKIIDRVSKDQFSYLNKEIDITCSMGFAHYPFDETAPKAMSWDQVSTLADKALYSAKTRPGVTWCGAIKAKREINDLYVNELMHCQKISQVTDLVEIVESD